jgi:hypothetical protein
MLSIVMIAKQTWTELRLQRLFAYYNRRFWRGRLPTIHIRIRELMDALGRIEWEQREILIKVNAHKNDREIRATLLHEMAHLGTRRKLGHGSEFWAQIEHLLRQRAPVTVGDAETPDVRILQNVVPARFPLARRAVNRSEKKRAREIEKLARKHKLPTQTITDADIATQFYDAAAEVTWRDALSIIGLEMGLLNVDGKPKDRWAAAVIAKGRRAHARGRRDHLSWTKAQRELETRFAVSGETSGK